MTTLIPFNRPCVTGKEKEYLNELFVSGRFSGDNEFTKKCCAILDRTLAPARTLLTTSCTHALEMAVILSGIGPGDEVIMPSYTFTSSAAAVVMRGGVPVFIDIRPDTMNMDENLIAEAITPKTKALMPVHYAGVACAMDEINALAKLSRLFVIEDAAQAYMSSYRGRPAGTLGDFGCFSFHETKNLQCGEGGCLSIRGNDHYERAEVLREKGTDRSRFWRGEIDKYTWRDMGSSYLPSELNAAFLLAQLEAGEQITKDRLRAWNIYKQAFTDLENRGDVETPKVPEGVTHNGHIFYLKVHDEAARDSLINFLRGRGVYSVFHYVPLHTSPAGTKYCRFHGEDRFTTGESSRLLRLPIYYGITDNELERVAAAVGAYFCR